MGRMAAIRSKFRRRAKRVKSPRLRIFLWAALVGLIFGAIGLGDPLEEIMRNGRNAARSHAASGEIVIVAIDDRSLERVKSWPWPRRYYAEMTEVLHALGAKEIFFDIDFSSHANAEDDRTLERTLARLAPKATLPVQLAFNPVSGESKDVFPVAEFRKHVELATINLDYDRHGAVWKLPHALHIGGQTYPSLSAKMAASQGKVGTFFRVDYSIDPRSIPTVSAVDLLARKVSSARIAGKNVVIGGASTQLGDIYLAPGHGRLPGVYIQTLGAETLRTGTPIDLGWALPFLVVLVIAGCSLRSRTTPLAIGALSTTTIITLAAPFGLESSLIFLNIVPALAVLITILGSVGWSAFRLSYRKRAATNPVSGLPNLSALRQQEAETKRPLIAARIQNFAEITSTLPPEKEKAIVEQIAARLMIGQPVTGLFQGDEGIFAWFADETMSGLVGDHLDALSTMFRSPIVVGDTQVDLSVTFGIDVGSDRSLANRLGSALVAADEAAVEGSRWKEYDTAKLKDSAWKLSLLSQLDAAIDSGDLWVAYQPKLDLATNRITGAEALVRWSHPEKGEISPMEFIPAAENSDRIEKLTNHVLRRAIATAAAINARGMSFGIAVNLSARLIDNSELVGTVTHLLARYKLPPACLTLEVTETAALATGANLAMLEKLRALGVQISIDDYGTGLSTLAYLKRIPATEIKIDKSFVQSMDKSQSDRLMVNSTIQLAHSLGQRVVAEGVEDRETLAALARMGCDTAQGFIIARPMPLRALTQFLLAESARQAA